jgi:hypothetical protein
MGGAIIAWMKDHTTIHVQRVDGSGPKWNAPVVISDEYVDQYYTPLPLPDGTGGAYVFHLGLVGNDDVTYKVQRVDANGGTPWGDSALNISGNTNSIPQGYWAYHDEASNFFFYYYHYMNGEYVYRCQKVVLNGSLPWGLDGVTITNGSRSVIAGAIVGTNDGGIITTWQEKNEHDNLQIRARVIGTDGEFLCPSINISDSYNSTFLNYFMPDGNDGAFFAYFKDYTEDNNHLHIQRISKNGSLYWDQTGINISHPNVKPSLLRMIPDGMNGIIMVWKQNRDPINHTIEYYGLRLGLGFMTEEFPRTAKVYEEFRYEFDSNYGEDTTWTMETTADWLTLDEGTGILRGIPDHSDIGNTTIIILARGNDFSYSYEFSLEVIDSDINFTNLPDEPLTAIEDQFFGFDLNSTSEGMDLTAYSIIEGPAWLDISEQSGNLYGIPSNKDVGNGSVRIRVTNGYRSAVVTHLTLQVENTNDAPVIFTDSIPFAYEDEEFTFSLTANDIDPTNDTLIWTLRTNAEWLEFFQNGTISGIPLQEHVGSFWINMTVSDGNGGEDQANLSFKVIATNDAPYLVSTPITDAYEDMMYECMLNVTDPDGDDLIWSIPTSPDWLSLSNGTLSGIPLQQDVGNHTVVINVSDSQGGRITISFDITVFNTNDPPSIEPIDDLSMIENQNFELDLAATDPDTNDQFEWSMDTNASWLSINKDTEKISGTTSTGYYFVNVTVRDLKGAFSSRNFTITVHPDLDGDLIPDHLDDDMDGDGVENDEDAYPMDPNKWETEVTDDDDDDQPDDDDDEGNRSEGDDTRLKPIYFIIPILVMIVVIVVVIMVVTRKKDSDEWDIEE